MTSLWQDKLICPPVFKPPEFKSPFSFHLASSNTKKLFQKSGQVNIDMLWVMMHKIIASKVIYLRFTQLFSFSTVTVSAKKKRLFQWSSPAITVITLYADVHIVSKLAKLYALFILQLIIFAPILLLWVLRVWMSQLLLLEWPGTQTHHLSVWHLWG